MLNTLECWAIFAQHFRVLSNDIGYVRHFAQHLLNTCSTLARHLLNTCSTLCSTLLSYILQTSSVEQSVEHKVLNTLECWAILAQHTRVSSKQTLCYQSVCSVCLCTVMFFVCRRTLSELLDHTKIMTDDVRLNEYDRPGLGVVIAFVSWKDQLFLFWNRPFLRPGVRHAAANVAGYLHPKIAPNLFFGWWSLVHHVWTVWYKHVVLHVAWWSIFQTIVVFQFSTSRRTIPCSGRGMVFKDGPYRSF